MSRREQIALGRIHIPNSTTGHQGSRVSVTLTPVAVAAASCVTQSVTIPGVSVGDMVMLMTDPIVNSLDCSSCLVTATDTVSMRFINPTAGSLTPASGTYTFLIFKQ